MPAKNWEVRLDCYPFKSRASPTATELPGGRCWLQRPVSGFAVRRCQRPSLSMRDSRLNVLGRNIGGDAAVTEGAGDRLTRGGTAEAVLVRLVGAGETACCRSKRRQYCPPAAPAGWLRSACCTGSASGGTLYRPWPWHAIRLVRQIDPTRGTGSPKAEWLATLRFADAVPSRRFLSN
jgi:hypothetical protein